MATPTLALAEQHLGGPPGDHHCGTAAPASALSVGDFGAGRNRGDADLAGTYYQLENKALGAMLAALNPWGRERFEQRWNPDGAAASAGRETEEVCEVLEKDIRDHGAPLVSRMDRARQHDDPRVRALLEQHCILVLQGPPHYPQYYGQLERQNREHRAVLNALAPVTAPVLLEQSRLKITAIDTRRLPRAGLAYRTGDLAESQSIASRCEKLRQDVQRMTAKLQSKMGCRGFPADMAERLAIEAALTKRGLLSRQGGRC